MNLRYISLILFQTCTLSLFAMSPNEKTEFKRQLKAAQTSAAMEQVVRVTGRLQPSQAVKLNISASEMCPVGFFTKTNDMVTPDSDLFRAVNNAVEEVFFEEMHPFIYTSGRVDVDAEAAKFAKYEWADKNVVKGVQGIFGAKVVHEMGPRGNNGATEPAHLQHQFQYVKNQIAQLTGENRLWGGKNDFAKRLEWFVHKNPGIGVKVAKYTVGGLAVVALLGGVYYYWTSKSDTQDEEYEHEENRNDATDKESHEIA
jgi:hypothetical protein